VKSVGNTGTANASGAPSAAVGASLPASGSAAEISEPTSTGVFANPSAPASTCLPTSTGGPTVTSPPAQLGSERGTRARIARLILENGPVTAAALSTRLGLTPAAVRRHLDNLLAGGLIEARTARRLANRGRGRPAKLFVITDAGRSAFEHAYDDLATSALRFLAEVAGPGGVAEFAHRQVAELERRYRQVMEAAAPEDKVKALAEALSADGYAASATSAPTRGAVGGEQLCQHHCPVAHVAAEFPQLCEAETEAFARLLGTPVQRLATIANGDGICTTHVTAPALVHIRTTTTPTS
jgi:predicted ArsR family transcriptional regulator